MLAMIAVVLLQANRHPSHPGIPPSLAYNNSTDCMIDTKSPNSLDEFRTPLTSRPKFPGGGYFNLSRRRDPLHSNASTPPVWPRPSSPAPPLAATSSSSSSSRGSWSSLFNTGSMRHFMSGMQDTLKDGLATPTVENSTPPDASTLVPGGEQSQREPASLINTNGRNSILPNSNVSKGWGESLAPGAATAFSPPGHIRRSTFSQGMNPRVTIPEKRILIFDEIVEEEYVHDYCIDPYVTDATPRDDDRISLEAPLLLQLVRHVLIYAERLFSWEMFHKRLELLKSVDEEIQKISPPHKPSGLGQTGLGMSVSVRLTPILADFTLGVANICDQCGVTLGTLEKPCDNCSNRSKRAQCTICRLPVKGKVGPCLINAQC